MSGFNLTDFHKAMLAKNERAGIACLNNHWEKQLEFSIKGNFCHAIWDGLNCWPAALPNQTVHIPCSQTSIGRSFLHKFPSLNLSGSALRLCSEDGTWAWDSYSNYSSCTRIFKQSIREQSSTTESPSLLKAFIPYVLLTGSVLSIVCLVIAISVFVYLKSMYLDRLKILLQMMVALLLKSVLWVLIVGPATFPNWINLETPGWTCKVVIPLHFYSLLVATFWMVVLGHFLNEKTRTEHAGSGMALGKYAVFSWALPALIVSVWASLMELTSDWTCWRNYTQSSLFWIIVVPLVASILGNLVYLLHIFTAVSSRFQFSLNPSRLNQIQKAKRDMAILFPLLGINNVLFLYNPGGTAEEYYMLFHALVQSVQGGIIAILCCFVSAHVTKALWKKLNRSFCTRERQRHIELVGNKNRRRAQSIPNRKDQSVSMVDVC